MRKKVDPIWGNRVWCVEHIIEKKYCPCQQEKKAKKRKVRKS